jgi:hypothetical protein
MQMTISSTNPQVIAGRSQATHSEAEVRMAVTALLTWLNAEEAVLQNFMIVKLLFQL